MVSPQPSMNAERLIDFGLAGVPARDLASWPLKESGLNEAFKRLTLTGDKAIREFESYIAQSGTTMNELLRLYGFRAVPGSQGRQGEFPVRTTGNSDLNGLNKAAGVKFKLEKR